MNSFFSEMRNQLNMTRQFTSEEVSKPTVRFVHLLTQGLSYVRQDARLAGLIIIVANIFFTEIALQLTDLLKNVLRGCSSLDGKRIFIFSPFFITVLAGMNVALAKGLKSQLNPLTIVGISMVSCFSFTILRLPAYRSKKESGVTQIISYTPRSN